MNIKASLDNHDHGDEELDISYILRILWKAKWLIVLFSISFSLVAMIYSLSLQNIYQSKTLLSPVKQQDSAGPIQNFGGLAGLAGISLSENNRSKESEAIEKIKSLSFFTNHIMPNIFLPNLMALSSWSPENNTLTYQEELFNINTNSWVRQYQFPKSQIPSPQESFKAFKKLMNVTHDLDTGFVTITIKHQSPYIAKAWTELIVDEINNFFRESDKLEAQAGIDFLTLQLNETSYSEIRQVIAALFEQKLQKMTLIEANKFYIFSYIDPPTVAEEKFEPSRTSITILGAVIGFTFSILLALLQGYIFDLRSQKKRR